jgi:hypothetical protein
MENNPSLPPLYTGRYYSYIVKSIIEGNEKLLRLSGMFFSHPIHLWELDSKAKPFLGSHQHFSHTRCDLSIFFVKHDAGVRVFFLHVFFSHITHLIFFWFCLRLFLLFLSFFLRFALRVLFGIYHICIY